MTAPVLLRRKSDCKLFIEVERVQHVYSEEYPPEMAMHPDFKPPILPPREVFTATMIQRVVLQEMAWIKPDIWNMLASSVLVDADSIHKDFERIVVPVQQAVIQQASAMPRLSGEVDGR